MVALILTNLKHFGVTFLLLLTALICFDVDTGADAHLFEDKLAYQPDDEVHVFYQDGQTITLRIKGDNERGFAVTQQTFLPLAITAFRANSPRMTAALLCRLMQQHKSRQAL